MKTIYESFTEIAEHFTDGECIFHVASEHSPDDCYGWQTGVLEFAKFLDGVGLKLVANSDFAGIMREEWDKGTFRMKKDVKKCTSKKRSL
jgi:hypothetical protein